MTINKVQWSLGSTAYGTWVDCNSDDGSFNSTSEDFSCNLNTTSLSEGSHTVYVRSMDNNGLYSPASSYSTKTLTIDLTSPSSSYIDTNGEKKEFQANQANDNLFTQEHYPAFTFTKSSDTSEIDKYQIIISMDQPTKEVNSSSFFQDKVYIDNIPHQAPGGNNIREDNEKYIQYQGTDQIMVYSKRSEDYLPDGAYQWKVRAIDKAGNTKDTNPKILRINTLQSLFTTNTFFPLSILNLGGQATNLTNLWKESIPDNFTFNINTQTPTFYGIALSNTKVTLTLKDLTTINQETQELSTIANPENFFGINITTPLELNHTYQVTLKAQKDNDYVELKSFNLKVGRSGPTVFGVTSDINQNQEEDKGTLKEVKGENLLPSPKPSVIIHIPKETPETQSSIMQKIKDFFKKILSF